MRSLDVYGVAVIGAGPAGLAAGISSFENGASTIIIEREWRPGGILKQCIHDGFGLIEFKERLTGPEYAERFINTVKSKKIPLLTSTFVTSIEKNNNLFTLTLVDKSGVFKICSKSLVLANGCRERTSKQVAIHGTRPSGILTAGTAQYFVNIMGYLPCKRCIVLGSGDIGLIMARRLTLEGAEVLGVYEAKPNPSGLTRNIVQCLDDFSIPLYLSKTVTRIFGDERVEAVEISSVDENINPIRGTEEIVECDGVILSVGLIPENEIAESLKIRIDKNTKGPFVDQNLMTGLDGVFSCGNALHVNDIVDYVTESGRTAGRAAAKYILTRGKRKLINIDISYKDFLYALPQQIDLETENKNIIMYFRSKDIVKNKRVVARFGDSVLFDRRYNHLRPPEMERIEFNIKNLSLNENNKIAIAME